MTMAIIKRITILVLIVGFCGCASIVSKSSYPVVLNSTPDGASITVTDKDGTQIYKGRTPTTLTLASGTGYFSGAVYNISFEKDGYESRQVTLQKELDGWYLGNILFGGLIGILIVDPLTGAMWKLPKNLTTSLEEKVSAFNLDGQSMEVAMLQDVPEELRKDLVPVH